MSRQLRDRIRATLGSIIVIGLWGIASGDHMLASAARQGNQTTASAVPLRGLYDTGKALGTPVILSLGATPRLLAAGDDDGDGVVDLVVANGDDDHFGVFRGDGRGRFSDGGISRVRHDKVVAHVDVDGDGRDDEIVGRAASLTYSVRPAGAGRDGCGGVLVALVTDFNRDGVAI